MQNRKSRRASAVPRVQARSRKHAFRERVNKLDQMILRTVPVYAFMKTVISSFARAEEEGNTFRPVPVRLDGMAAVAFEIERSVTWPAGRPPLWI